MHNNIENGRFSPGKKADIIRVVAPCSLVAKKWAEAPKFEAAGVLFGNMPPYSLVVGKNGQKPSHDL